MAIPTTALACFDPEETGPLRVEAPQDIRPWLGDPFVDPSAEVPVLTDAPAEIFEEPAAEAPVEPAATPGPSDSAAPSGALAEVLALVNKERTAVGCPVLTVNEKLTKAAQDHSEDMAAHSNMSHTGSDGSDPGQRITRAGYEWRTYAENVAYGYPTAAKVMEGWMNSPGHKRNILDCDLKEIGIGLAQPGQYWTQDFGTTR
ncbi:CAP domain-containing protein [Streptomyces sp. NPDC002812]|uniref:CAP domain-containing protein n=1 Tax=Streptomyces sp. NPDC002812 TaxID=3154434 RepID=UPI003326F8A0